MNNKNTFDHHIPRKAANHLKIYRMFTNSSILLKLHKSLQNNKHFIKKCPFFFEDFFLLIRKFLFKLHETFESYDKVYQNHCTKAQNKYNEYSKASIHL